MTLEQVDMLFRLIKPIASPGGEVLRRRPSDTWHISAAKTFAHL